MFGFIFEIYAEIFGSDFQGFTEIFGPHFSAPKWLVPISLKCELPPEGGLMLIVIYYTSPLIDQNFRLDRTWVCALAGDNTDLLLTELWKIIVFPPK